MTLHKFDLSTDVLESKTFEHIITISYNYFMQFTLSLSIRSWKAIEFISVYNWNLLTFLYRWNIAQSLIDVFQYVPTHYLLANVVDNSFVAVIMTEA